MLQFSFSPFSSLRWTQRQDIECGVELGLDGIGVWRSKLEELGCPMLNNSGDILFDLLSEAKLTVSSLHHCGGFTGNWGLSFKEAIEDVHVAIELAHKVQAECLLVHPGGRWIHTLGQQKRIVRDALNEIVPIAQDYGVRLALEPQRACSKNNWTMLNSINCALDMISRFSDKSIGIVLDLFDYGNDLEVLGSLPNWINRLALVQLTDRIEDPESMYHSPTATRCLLGHGELPLEDWFEALKEIDYQGFVEFEIFGHAVESMDYHDVIQHSAKSVVARRNAIRTHGQQTVV